MRSFFTLVLGLFAFSLFAQEPSKYDLAPCGTPPGIDPWLKEYYAHPQNYVTARSIDTLYVALQLHLLAKDNGSGRFSPERVLAAFCQLNADYAPSGIRFFFKNDWDLIDNTLWYQHTTIPQGIDMMLTNNVDSALNAYFAASVAGNCGYNLKYAGVAIAHSCAASGDHTWAHEVGHALSLPHPFIGWEGKNYNSANPTPTQVTYDYTYFHDTIDTQIPAPLDTALVEYLDGSNCDIAADLICDTKPDYLSNRWPCDGQSNSLSKEYDPAGASFYSDGTLYMSYSYDECQTRFSDEEISAMRANLVSVKSAWLADSPAEQDITGMPALLMPAEGENTPTTGITLTWSSVPHATHYLLQYTRISSFTVKEFELVTADTSFTITSNLLPNKNYYWRVRPFNHWYACTNFAPQQSFFTTPATATTEPDDDGWRCYPTLLRPGQALTLELSPKWLNQNSRYSVYDAMGRQVWQAGIEATSRQNLSLPSGAWPAGAYTLVYYGESGVKTRVFILAGK